MSNLLMLNAKDNVAVCLTDGQIGETFSLTAKDGHKTGSIKLLDAVPFAHKVARVDIDQGEKIFKYGEMHSCCQHTRWPRSIWIRS